MILISGNDPIVEHLCTSLDSLGRSWGRVEELDMKQAWEQKATTLILVEPLPRVAAPAPASGRGLHELVSAANAPGVQGVIVVTPRPDDDPELRTLRRSGAPYTILRPLPLFERADAGDDRVLIARDVSTAPAAAVTVDLVAEAVIAALDGGACGRTLAVAPPAGTTWADLLARAGTTAKPVARWRARVGRWFGARTLEVPSTDRAASPA